MHEYGTVYCLGNNENLSDQMFFSCVDFVPFQVICAC